MDRAIARRFRLDSVTTDGSVTMVPLVWLTAMALVVRMFAAKHRYVVAAVLTLLSLWATVAPARAVAPRSGPPTSLATIRWASDPTLRMSETGNTGIAALVSVGSFSSRDRQRLIPFSRLLSTNSSYDGRHLLGVSHAANATNYASLDTNALVSGIQRGEAAAVDTVLAGRAPLVSPTAVNEYLAGGGTLKGLRAFLKARGGVIGADASPAALAQLEARLTALNKTLLPAQQRVLGVADACIAAAACEAGTALITRDGRLFKTLNALGIAVEGY